MVMGERGGRGGHEIELKSSEWVLAMTTVRSSGGEAEAEAKILISISHHLIFLINFLIG